MRFMDVLENSIGSVVVGWKRYFISREMRANFISRMAKVLPIQFLGPEPKGRNV